MTLANWPLSVVLDELEKLAVRLAHIASGHEPYDPDEENVDTLRRLRDELRAEVGRRTG